MLKGARLVVILRFLAGFGMILLFMPKDFSKAMGDGFDISQVEQIQVTLVPVEGDETLTVTLNQGEEEYVDLITLLQEPTYSRTSSKSDEISLDYWVKILFSDGEIWPWSYDFQADKLVYCPSFQAGSLITASRCTLRKAIAKGEAADEPEIDTRRRAPPGATAAKAVTTMPPSEGPITASSCSMPSVRAASKPARAMSSTASSGNSSRYGRPEAGFTEAGPGEPKQLPSEFTHITNQRSVSMARPGPIMLSHQPGVGSAADEAAWDAGLRPVNSRMALLRSAFSAPQHS